MKFNILALLFFISSSFCTSNNNRFRTVCLFLPGDEEKPENEIFTVENVDAKMCTHFIYDVFKIDFGTDEIESSTPRRDIEQERFQTFETLKLKNPDIKTMIFVTTARFEHYDYAAVAANKTRITKLVNSIVATLDKYNTDGLLLAFPSEESFVDIAEALQQAFPPQKYLFTGGIELTFDLNRDVAIRMNQILDFVNLFTFSYNFANVDPDAIELADHHAPLYGRTSHSKNSVDFTVNQWIASGFPPDKIVIGIPLFGHGWFVSSNETKPPAPITEWSDHLEEFQIKYMSYDEICQLVRNESWEVFQDSSRKMGPYAISPINANEKRKGIGYDDPAMAAVKANYIKEKGLGGAFVVELPMDDFRNKCGDGFNPMLTAISNTLNAPSSITGNNEKTSFEKLAAFVLGLISSLFE